jgi:hypothetical protein
MPVLLSDLLLFARYFRNENCAMSLTWNSAPVPKESSWSAVHTCVSRRKFLSALPRRTWCQAGRNFISLFGGAAFFAAAAQHSTVIRPPLEVVRLEVCL